MFEWRYKNVEYWLQYLKYVFVWCWEHYT